MAAIVADCTDAWVVPKPAWRPRKEAYLAALPKKPATSLLVSLADKVDNAEAILADYRVLGDEVWDRFTGGRGGDALVLSVAQRILQQEPFWSPGDDSGGNGREIPARSQLMPSGFEKTATRW